MKISKYFINFNKEILSGEVGAILGAQLAGFISRFFYFSEKVISSLAVLGAVLGAGILYLFVRIINQKKTDNFTINKFSKDIVFYSCGAISLTVLVYYPSLYFLEKYLLKLVKDVNVTTFIAQTLAFILFLIFINLYRYILKKCFKRII